MNYFEFFEIPIAFQLDEANLKKKFYKNSKRFHPDFYTLEEAAKQAEALELSSLNNEAYKVLSDFDKRMKYILELESVMGAEGENKMPQAFLMEMMEVNETLMELEFDYDAAKLETVKADIAQKEATLRKVVALALKNYDLGIDKTENLKRIKDFYLKNRYLLRIYKNLNKFAPH